MQILHYFPLRSLSLLSSFIIPIILLFLSIYSTKDAHKNYDNCIFDWWSTSNPEKTKRRKWVLWILLYELSASILFLVPPRPRIFLRKTNYKKFRSKKISFISKNQEHPRSPNISTKQADIKYQAVGKIQSIDKIQHVSFII